ncbi:hypothetical protein [Dyadobacter tibetensis]|uniref:hypothetical protein n=1 Tax=Dyadobacter tibetensis TaxID=1211851 RepID=UPI00047202E8|nr:hypothetical protein [Dyadobacter tibetensis]
MKKLINVLILILFVSVTSYGQKIPVDTIFANYYQATGGKKLWDSIKTYTLKQSFSAPSATPYTADISVSIPENAMYKSKTIMRRSFVYGVKDKEGWIKVPIGSKMDVRDLSPAEQTNMRYEIYDQLVPFMDYQNRGFVATTVGQETLNKVLTNQVELQGKEIKYNLWFDAKTGLLVRKKETMAGVETTTDLSNYTKSDFGILYPAKMVEINTVDKKAVTIASQLEINKSIPEEVFIR